MTRLPAQLDNSPGLVRSWAPAKPAFLGLPVTPATAAGLLQTESLLASGVTEGLDSQLCRALAAWHGPKGDKVPLTNPTVSGCPRPEFVALNPWLSPSSSACYDGGCYLNHARAVPAKRGSASRVTGHKADPARLAAAASLARHFGVCIRDNQSSDGSFSMTLRAPGETLSLLHRNLATLDESGFGDVPWLCMATAYVRVHDDDLAALAVFGNLVVHVTVSGWHSKEENLLRLAEFERYAALLPNVFLRVVNRMDWAGVGAPVADSGARMELWLLAEIERRGLPGRVIRTPFHSVHPFPGGRPRVLGTRHMAGADYTEDWARLSAAGARECCTTGKCKTCPTRCGAPGASARRDPLIAARALEAMLSFETARQAASGDASPLASYTARLIARKGAEAYAEAADGAGFGRMTGVYERFDRVVCTLCLDHDQRRRLANDSHALVMGGLDRHGLWARASALFKVGGCARG